MKQFLSNIKLIHCLICNLTMFSKRQQKNFICRGLLSLILTTQLFLTHIVSADDQWIRIGVLSHRGDVVTHEMWAPTAQYLSDSLESYQFKIIPLTFSEIDPMVESEQVDFLLVNSGIYVNMEVRHRISRIVTLNNQISGIAQNVFGGVIFTRNIRHDIKTLRDLRGKKLSAVDETSLGGFQMALGVLKQQKINPYHDLATISFEGTHDKVVKKVLAGDTDIGMVRSGILEKMSADGEIDLNNFKIINAIENDGFPSMHSTPLYPEWPFSKLQHTSNELAQKVAVALLNMKDKHTAINNYACWTVPLDYQQVHQLFKELHIAPYEKKITFTLLDAIKQYWKGIVVVLFFIVVLTIMSTWVSRLNTQLKKSKQSLEYQHNLILNSVCDGIYGVDMQGNCTFINRAMENLTGWKIEDMINHNQHDLLHHTHEDGSPHKIEDCPVYLTFKNNESRFIKDDIFWKKEGNSFPVEYSSTPMRDHKGEIIGSVVVFRDISEKKKAEEEALKHQKEMSHMARLNTMGEMASGIAHEINQPLTAIATNAFACIQMLESETINNNKVIDTLETIGVQAEHSGQIIKQLRQFVRKEQHERSMTNINQLIEQVLTFLKPEILKSAVILDKQLDERVTEVLVQPIQIEQVVLNLLKNSIEAMQSTSVDNRYLSISTAMVGDNAMIVSVEDNGPGIDNKIKDDLFLPFVTSKEGGLGLGLSISEGIIEAHKGKLYLDNSSKQGTIIRFTLPMENLNE